MFMSSWERHRRIPVGFGTSRPVGRSSAACVSIGAEKKESFDRGGPVWPPRSNVTNDRLRGVSGGALPPQPKIFKNTMSSFFIFCSRDSFSGTHSEPTEELLVALLDFEINEEKPDKTL